jgi:hypothetical protein
MAINRLGVSQPSANTDTLIYTSPRNAIVSIIATNLSSSAATIRTWTVPSGATLPSQYSYHTYDTNLPGNNTLETFRFAIMNGDTIYVRASTANVSFAISGIYESNGTSNITVSTTAPTLPTIGDLWLNSTNDDLFIWNGTSWVAASGSAVYYQTTAPSTPEVGTVWVDSDDTTVNLNANDYLLKADIQQNIVHPFLLMGA